MAETRVYLLDGGSLVIDGFHVFWNHGPAGEVRFPCYSVLVDHPEGKFVFDTGYDYGHVMKVLPFEKPLQTSAQTIPAQLALIGLAPADVTHVINSHYHFDHCGGNKYLTRATTLCHKLEFEACKCPQPFEKLGYSDLSFAPEIAAVATEGGGKTQTPDPRADIYTPRFELLKGDQQIAKGLYLFETPGHTAGHYSMMVTGLAGRRAMLFSGDACYTKQSMERKVISSFHLDPVASLLSLRRLEELAAEFDAEIFFSHDMASYQGYKRAPEYYA